jgi:uncharacterized protein (TIGR03437 family)
VKFAWIFLLAAWPAWAQFTGIATTRDGSTVYVSTPLRLKGTAQSLNGKVFRLAGGRPELFAEQLPGVQIGWYNEKFYDLTQPDVSGDGSVVAYTGSRGCGGGSGCLSVQRAQGTVADASGNALLDSAGYVNVSPNGQYALFFGRNTFASVVPPAELVSPRSGERTTVPYPISAQARRRVTNDGSVAVFKDGAVRLWSISGETTIGGASIAAAGYNDPLLMIGADGRRLVYQTRLGVARYDRTAGAEELIVTAIPASVAIDENAATIAYVDGVDGEIHLAGRDGAAFTVPEGFAQVALSGDGRVGYAETRLGRLLRLDLGTGATQELIPRTPWIQGVNGTWAAGSLLSVTGVGLSGSGEPGGVRVRIAGIDAPVESVSPEHVWFQVPWEVPAQTSARFEFLSGDSPFETGPATVNVQAVAPFAYGTVDTSNGYNVWLTAAHQDWSGLVTRENPARAGEVIVLYFGGLGPVTPPVATGEPSPAGIPARLTADDFACDFWDGSGHRSKLWFAGLAPGMVGVYQANVEVPAGLKKPSVAVSCGMYVTGPNLTAGSLYVAQ